MIDKLEVTIDVIIHATEDISKFLKSFEDIFELNDSFTINETLGHFENVIIVLSRKIEKKQAQKFIGRLIEEISKEQIAKLVEEIEERTIDSRIQIRLDKQEFIKRNILLSDRD
jgi:RNA binding exosome subunit